MSTFEITSKQITDLHNGKCALYRLQEMITENYKDESSMVKSVREAMRLMTPVIKELMDKKDEQDTIISNEMEMIREKLGLNSIWSIYGRTEFPQSWAGKKVIYQGLECEIPSDVKISGEVLYVVANKLIEDSKDGHHIFIEGFYENSKGSLELVTGS